MMDGAGISNDDGMGGNVTIDKSSRSDQDIVSDGNLPDHGCIDTNTHATADSWDPPARPSTFRADGYALMKMAIVTQDGSAIYGDIVGVAQIEPLPNPGTTRNLNPMFP